MVSSLERAYHGLRQAVPQDLERRKRSRKLVDDWKLKRPKRKAQAGGRVSASRTAEWDGSRRRAKRRAAG